MFQLGRHFIKFQGAKFYKSLFSQQQRYLTQVKVSHKQQKFKNNHSYLLKRIQVAPLIGYPLLKNNYLHFFYSSSTLKDYYKILDVPQNATQEQIKKQFHKLAKLYHPDSATSNGSDEKFKEVSEAYNTLGDQSKRSRYDIDRNLYKQQYEQSKRSNNQYSSSSSSSYQQNSQRNYERRQQYEQYETYNPYNRSKQQSAQDEQRYKTYKDYQGFQNKDFDQSNMVREGFFQNMKDAPELWILTWSFIAQNEHKKKNYTSDDDFEHPQPRGRISLKDEDIQGFNLIQLEQLDATGKYLLPPKAKASVDEFRRIAQAVDYDIKKDISPKNNKQQKSDIEGKQDDDDFNDDEVDENGNVKKGSILEQIIEKAEWDQAKKEEEQERKKKQQVKVQQYKSASTKIQYEQSAHPNQFSNLSYAQRYQNADKQKQKQTTHKQHVAELNEMAQQSLSHDIQNKAKASHKEIDAIQKVDPEKLQVFGQKQKRQRKEKNKVENNKGDQDQSSQLDKPQLKTQDDNQQATNTNQNEPNTQNQENNQNISIINNETNQS